MLKWANNQNKACWPLTLTRYKCADGCLGNYMRVKLSIYTIYADILQILPMSHALQYKLDSLISVLHERMES